MMQMQFGSYLFTHNPRRIELSFANHVAAHILPAMGAVSQPLGARCRIVKCEGEVFDAAPQGASEKLTQIAALCRNGVQMLHLPTGEQFNAFISRFGYAAQGDGRVITYYLEWMEQDSRRGETA